MSDYEVTLVNDNMQEFYVRFHGPSDSKWGAEPWRLLCGWELDPLGYWGLVEHNQQHDPSLTLIYHLLSL
jgi:hypothetical protein